MRVISGFAKGCRLSNANDVESIRPTSDRVKEALFSSIQFFIEGKSVLDLFAGSGQLGIEALSRGAKSCVFVDVSQAGVCLVKENIKKAKIMQNFFVHKCNWDDYLNKNNVLFDLVFLDPPYKMGVSYSMLEHLRTHLNDGAKIVCEMAREDCLDFDDNHFEVIKEKAYASSKIIILLRKS